MSDESDLSESNAKGGRIIDVHRDPGFTRVVADAAAVVSRGDDLEISFIASGPSVRSRQRLEGDNEGVIRYSFKMAPSLSETALVRLPLPAAIFLAMQILEMMVKKDMLHTELVIQSIREWSSMEERQNATPETAE